MNARTLTLMGAFLLAATSGTMAQKQQVANDSNTPLHLLQPDYKVPYGVQTAEEVKRDMDRVLRYLEQQTPARLVDKKTGKAVTDYSRFMQTPSSSAAPSAWPVMSGESPIPPCWRRRRPPATRLTARM